MPPNPILRCDELIKLVEEQKSSFTEEFRTLTPKEETRRTKADDLVSKGPKGLNDKQRKARTILRNLKLNVGHEVFLLCALATTPTGLGVSQLGDYIGMLSKWWEATDHPGGLRLVASRKYDEFRPLLPSLDRPAHQPHVLKPQEDREQTYLRKPGHVRHTPPPRKSPPAETGELATELLPAQTDRRMQDLITQDNAKISTTEIDYTVSGAIISLMPLLGDPLYDAVSASKQWKWERSVGGLTTDCLNAIVPEDPSQDISITLSVGHKMGLDLIRKFKLTPT
ncbi:hypothetical protein VC83_07571 [Pseudogymnoascus destructans]|uniref:Uncharacterized protein n=2 Tax=Pseudogymnoascus destructans TaxID=655981 RepID=L8GAL6_PSED2|nr:uncharacterized protein VC83_07571 [Pseudogymnoascus destructans]ELR10097.1 hypothetical protein GMDG_04497 [Pseudogymnoascus destructans 20631-21]OAF55511.2 hypothetical protein VC83_07571 [Pseudogymnoascus destructans]